MTSPQLFPALLRYWRTRRGLSQLSLAIEADVSARHISFLESARARPSEEMVRRLFSVMDVPLPDQDEALASSGFAPRASGPSSVLAPEMDGAIAQMMEQHEPFPLAAVALDGTILRQSRGAACLFGAFLASPEAVPPAGADLYSMLLDPRFLRPFIVEWESFARDLVTRLQREHLRDGDPRQAAALERILARPDVPRAWRRPDLSSAVPPATRLRLVRGDLRAGFLIAITTFATARQAPPDVRIESCFPLDDETRDLCRRLVNRAV